MSFHELNIEVEDSKRSNNVYIIPRSKNPDDYAIISTINEEELLRRGITGKITFFSYEPIRKDLEAKIKHFLKASFRQQLAQSKDKNKKIKLGLLVPPILALLFVFSGFFDDIFIDLAVAVFFIFIHRGELQEQSNITRIESRIDALAVKENPLLTEIFRSFQEIDQGELKLPDLESLKPIMTQEEIRDTLYAVGSFLHLDKIQEIQDKIRRLDGAIEMSSGLRREALFAFNRFVRWQLKREQKRLRQQIKVKPGFRDIYELLLEEGGQGYSSLLQEAPERPRLS